MTRADRILVAALAVVLLAAWPLAAASAGSASDTVTVSGPAGSSTYALGEDRSVTVAGTLGPVEVRIAEGAVSVTESTCPDRVCVETGSVSAAGSVIACVPNRVVVRLGGGERDGLDARVR